MLLKLKCRIFQHDHLSWINYLYIGNINLKGCHCPWLSGRSYNVRLGVPLLAECPFPLFWDEKKRGLCSGSQHFLLSLHQHCQTTKHYFCVGSFDSCHMQLPNSLKKFIKSWLQRSTSVSLMFFYCKGVSTFNALRLSLLYYSIWLISDQTIEQQNTNHHRFT